MEKKLIDRINQLAKKSKSVGLSPEETQERDMLRKQYISEFRESLRTQLDNTYIVDENGEKAPLKNKQSEE
ncbi:MAG: DUF896 domain-containing protein [Oscillospiraceae bacterium]|jgi:uncharacterized protein YnzC (UPF0291/DUF896 family)|nr:DUF896 domain-containing protein [Oscillospiraceae bacterium]